MEEKSLTKAATMLQHFFISDTPTSGKILYKKKNKNIQQTTYLYL